MITNTENRVAMARHAPMNLSRYITAFDIPVYPPHQQACTPTRTRFV